MEGMMLLKSEDTEGIITVTEGVTWDRTALPEKSIAARCW